MKQYTIDWARFTTIEELVEVFGKISLQITCKEDWTYFDEMLPYLKEVEEVQPMEVLKDNDSELFKPIEE